MAAAAFVATMQALQSATKQSLKPWLVIHLALEDQINLRHSKYQKMMREAVSDRRHLLVALVPKGESFVCNKYLSQSVNLTIGAMFCLYQLRTKLL